MNKIELKSLLDKINDVHIGIIGDFCLDFYIFIDSSESEISVETGLETRPVREMRFFHGGAGNIAHNLSAMGVRSISTFGVIGDDPFGSGMHNMLRKNGINTSGLIKQDKDWSTHVFTKLYKDGVEQNRIDFGNFNYLHLETLDLLIRHIDGAVSTLDIVIINQQVHKGIHTPAFRKLLKGLIEKYSETLFVVDSRKYSDDFKGALRKINDHEGAHLCGMERSIEEIISFKDARSIAEELYKRWQKPLFLTRGENGCIVYTKKGYEEIPGLQILSRIDTVGAGDSMLSGMSAALGAGMSPAESAEFGNFTAGVTVQKLFQTGTASPDEILEIGSDPDYRYRPDIAVSIRKANYLENTEIEIVTSLPVKREIKHAIFDHDGTISTLRQGWEEIMEPMMVKAVTGKKYKDIDEKTLNKVTAAINDYIDRTTGVQTLVQMKGLIDIINSFGLIAEDKILNEFEYKNIYNKDILSLANSRVKKLKNLELSIEDFTIIKSISFLKILHKKGILLYLASGTDQKDVIREAGILGYADLFKGGIYGAVGDISKEPKKIVLKRILADIGENNSQQIVTFGDGPVEIRETCKNRGLAIGVASDEKRRYGLNEVKRKRLILAGADIIIPDFSQMDQLLKIIL